MKTNNTNAIITVKEKLFSFPFFVAVLFVIVITIVPSCGKPEKWKGKTISVGSKGFTEQYIVSSIITLILEGNGYRVNEKFGTGSMITRQGLLTGQIDIYPEYTGTAWTLYLKEKEKINDPELLFHKVKEEDYRTNMVVWMDKTSINNTYALAIRKKDEKLFGNSLSSLAEYIRLHPEKVIFGVAHEFYERPDGFRYMLRHYGMTIPDTKVKTMDIGLSFESINRNQIDVAMVYSTDGKLKKYDLLVLTDDRKFFPIYNLCFVCTGEIIKKYPELNKLLSPISRLLGNDVIQQMNYEVDALGKPAKLVADEFIKKYRLLNNK